MEMTCKQHTKPLNLRSLFNAPISGLPIDYAHKTHVWELLHAHSLGELFGGSWGKRALCWNGLERAASRRGAQAEERISFDIFVALLWDSLADNVYRKIVDLIGNPELASLYIDRRSDNPTAKRSKTDAKRSKFFDDDQANWKASAAILVGALPDPGDMYAEPISVQECAVRVQERCVYAFNGDVQLDLIMDHISSLCINAVEPSLFLADVICLSDMMTELIGPCLSLRLRAYVHASALRIDGSFAGASLEQDLIDELLSTRRALTMAKAAASAGDAKGVLSHSGPSLLPQLRPRYDFQGTRDRNSVAMLLKTATLQLVISTRIAAAHLPTTFKEVNDLYSSLGCVVPDEIRHHVDQAAGRCTIGKHSVLLDSAIDIYTADRISKAWCKHNTQYRYSGKRWPELGLSYTRIFMHMSYAGLCSRDPIANVLLNRVFCWFLKYATNVSIQYRHIQDVPMHLCVCICTMRSG
jgi:hypothetical protein